jgi:hypothetical protein
MMPGGSLSPNRMATNIEMISTSWSIPKPEAAANATRVLGNKLWDFCLGVNSRVISKVVYWKWEEKEMGFLWCCSKQWTVKQGHLEHVFTEVITQFWIVQWVLMG